MPPAAPKPVAPPKPVLPAHGGAPKKHSNAGTIGLFAGCAAILGAGAVAPPAFVSHLTVFVLACFVGWQVVWNVTAALHTPLMSVTNAISGIIIVGGMLQIGSGLDLATVLGALAVLLAAINVSGGFLVTQRMLKMFRRNPDAAPARAAAGHGGK